MAPRNIKLIRNKIADGTVVANRAKIKRFRVIVPSSARVKEKYLEVRLRYRSINMTIFAATQVQYFDVIWQIISILRDPDLQEGFLTEPNIQGAGDARQFGEMNTGAWWSRTQMEAPEASSEIAAIFL